MPGREGIQTKVDLCGPCGTEIRRDGDRHTRPSCRDLFASSRPLAPLDGSRESRPAGGLASYRL